MRIGSLAGLVCILLVGAAVVVAAETSEDATRARELWQKMFAPVNTPMDKSEGTARVVLYAKGMKRARFYVKWSVSEEPFAISIEPDLTRRSLGDWTVWGWHLTREELISSNLDASRKAGWRVQQDPNVWRWSLSGRWMRDPPLLGNWLGWMLALTEKPPAKVCIVSQDTRACRVMLQAEWEQAIPRHVGELFTKAEVEVDTERVAPVALRCFDKIGRQVQETTYTDLKRLPSGRWMPLTWQTMVARGKVIVASPGGTTGPEKEPEKEETVDCPERAYLHKFFVDHQGRVQLKSIAMFGPGKELLMTIVLNPPPPMKRAS